MSEKPKTEKKNSKTNKEIQESKEDLNLKSQETKLSHDNTDRKSYLAEYQQYEEIYNNLAKESWKKLDKEKLQTPGLLKFASSKYEFLISDEISRHQIKTCPNSRVSIGLNSYVWKGYFYPVDKFVAVKTSKEVEPKRTDFERIINEKTLLSKMNHMNVIKFFGIILRPKWCLVTEWCFGPDLNQFVHIMNEVYWKRSSNDEILNIAKQIATGLDYVHSLDIIHRNLKASNILLTPNDMKTDNHLGKWTVKLSNFAMSTSTYYQQIDFVNRIPIHYMAPEVINPKFMNRSKQDPYSYKSDTYALGILLYELFTGEIPFKSKKDPTEMVFLHIGLGVVSIREINLRYDMRKELKKLILESTNPDCNKRPSVKVVKLILKELEIQNRIIECNRQYLYSQND